jgi:UDP-N-acetylmuramyl pentapeptide phosphotransferase/UDP-N-acetylglucosamine-1-phosphate transferase
MLDVVTGLAVGVFVVSQLRVLAAMLRARIVMSTASEDDWQRLRWSMSHRLTVSRWAAFPVIAVALAQAVTS